MDRRTTDRWVGRVFVGAGVVVALMFLGILARMNAGAVTSPSDIRVADPKLAVYEARTLIEEKRRNASAFGEFTEPIDLPPALRIENLRYANVHVDHVDLVVARNPDVSIGARIWATHHRAHRDKSTRYSDIWFYRYENDSSETLTNIP